MSMLSHIRHHVKQSTAHALLSDASCNYHILFRSTIHRAERAGLLCVIPAVAAHTVPVDGMKAAAVAAEGTDIACCTAAAANVDTAAVDVAEAWARERGCAGDTVHSEHSEPAETAVQAVP